MPIYEYACDTCRTVFQFWITASKRQKRPSCPRCGRRGLSRVPSAFAVARGGGRSDSESGDGADTGGPDDLSPSQQREMERLLQRAGSLDEGDPRQLASFMRRMGEVTGVEMDGQMEEAIRRLEAGEDPERVEEEMGDLLDGGGTGGLGGYQRDDTIYDL